MRKKTIAEEVGRLMEKRIRDPKTRELIVDNLFLMAQQADANGFRAIEFIFNRLIGKDQSVNSAPMFQIGEELRKRQSNMGEE